MNGPLQPVWRKKRDEMNPDHTYVSRHRRGVISIFKTARHEKLSTGWFITLVPSRLLEEGANFRPLKSEALINRAKQYLAHTEKSVETIAADLGYQNPANFRRAFRKITCQSPGEYRNKLLS